ncbi:kinase-like domain-containing protein [Phlyctochytrium arcticum]|nr:kinase-like domain-containing protein [Phlyctochytrium arcticum]
MSVKATDNVPQVALEEVEALKAIYMEDFNEVILPVKSAWKVAPIREYTIRLQPQGEELKDLLSVTLAIRFKRRYPDELPFLEVRKEKGITDGQVLEIQKAAIEFARQLLGQAMIYDIATFIQEHLYRSNSVNRGGKQVSFFEQMQDRREQADKEEQARVQRDLERHRQIQEEAMNEENQLLAEQIQGEILKKQAKMREERERRRRAFGEEEIEMKTEDGSSTVETAPVSAITKYTLDAIAKGPRVHTGNLSTLYMVRLKEQSDSDEASIVLKEIIISNHHYISGEGKKKLFDAFTEAQKFTSIRHPNLVTIYDARIEKVRDFWRFDLLMEHCRGGSLNELVARCGGVQLSIARKYMKQLLKALAYLHSQNLIHKDIKSRNVLFLSGHSPDQQVKLSDSLYARRLLDLHKARPLHPPMPEEPQFHSGWIAPELLERPGVYGRKSDIWSLGRTFLEMVFGPECLVQYSGFGEIAPKASLVSERLLNLISLMLTPDPKQRPTALDLLGHSFLEDVGHPELPIALEILKSSSAVPSPATSFHRQLPPSTPQKSLLSSVSSKLMFPSQTLSRYRLDFEEIEFLGRGGFGEVVKARNRIDGRFYAIKKIKLDPKDREGSKRILREVQTLSRLHHQFVVRYYQAWFEEGAGEMWPSEDDSDDEDEGSTSEGGSASEDEGAGGFQNDWLTFDKSSKGYSNVSISFGHGDGQTTSSDAAALGDETSSSDDDDTGEGDTSSGGHLGLTMAANASHRILYIQMEYCERQTLRDVINEGLDDEESWRLFRQVLEGLAHIHSQGMIHRDLKPSNVFLDANGNVKIGDFGLALAREDEAGGTTNQSHHNTGDDSHLTSGDHDASLTGDVGTPVYVAPEVIAKNGKYNSKVDLYSLGICFFEMLYPFSSGMHRAIVLRDLRTPTITLPMDFDAQKHAAQHQILALLLNHAPKERPSALELLQSPLLPPKLEEESITEALRSIVNQNNPLYYNRLVTALFAQSTDRHKDFTYEFNSNAQDMDQMSGLVTARVYAHALRIFQRHGAVHLPAPLLMPKSDLYDPPSLKKPVELLDSSGNIVHLPYDLTAPFARLVARCSQTIGPLPLKRFTIEPVYRCNTVGGQPRSVLECDFDIVTTHLSNMCPEAEVIKVVMELLECVATRGAHPAQLEIRINHCSLLDAVLDTCLVPIDARLRRRVYHILEQLEKPMSWSQVRSHLAQAATGLPAASLSLLEKFHHARGPFEAAAKTFDALVDPRLEKAVRDVLGHLRVLVAHLGYLGMRNRVTFAPLLAYNATYYKSGVMFQIGWPGKKKIDVIAAGGRYDHLLTQFRYPFGPSKKLHGVGVHFALSKAISAIVAEQADNIRRRLPGPPITPLDDLKNHLSRRCDVLVVSFGKHPSALHERMSLTADLWAVNVATDLLYHDVAHASQDVVLQAEQQNYVIIVMIKQRNSESKPGIIKVRNLVTRAEEEVVRSDVVSHILSELADISAPSHHHNQHSNSHHSHHHPHTSHNHQNDNEPDLSTAALTSDRMAWIQAPWKRNRLKHKERLVTLERAAHSITTSLTHLRHAPLLALDLPLTTIHRLTCAEFHLPEDAFKRSFEDLASNVREYLCIVKRQVLRYWEEEQIRWFWMYSTVENEVRLFRLRGEK